jgi:hypothetical protein
MAMMLSRFALLVLLACSGPMCRRAQAPSGASAANASSSATPLDRLKPGELGAGSQEAFGLVLPRGMRIEQRVPRATYAAGDVAAEAVVEYVRERVTFGRVELAGSRTIFSEVRIRNGRPDRQYEMVVIKERGRCRLEVLDVTPDRAPVGLSTDERWKRAGLSPDGRLLDPDGKRAR